MASARLLPSLVSVGPLGDTCFSRAETAAWDPSPHARQETGQGQPARPRARGGRRCLPGPRLLGLLRLLTGLCVSVSVCLSVRLRAGVSLPLFVALCLCFSLFVFLTPCFSVLFAVPPPLLLRVLASLPRCSYLSPSVPTSPHSCQNVLPTNELSPASGLRARVSLSLFWVFRNCSFSHVLLRKMLVSLSLVVGVESTAPVAGTCR